MSNSRFLGTLGETKITVKLPVGVHKDVLVKLGDLKLEADDFKRKEKKVVDGLEIIDEIPCDRQTIIYTKDNFEDFSYLYSDKEDNTKKFLSLIAGQLNLDVTGDELWNSLEEGIKLTVEKTDTGFINICPATANAPTLA